MRRRPAGHCWTVAATDRLLVLFLLVCFQIRSAGGSPNCPPVGWTCEQQDNDWYAKSTLPGLESVKITYRDSKINVACSGEDNDSESDATIPDGILTNFTGLEPTDTYRLYRCRLTANQTLASVLSGQEVFRLVYTSDRPLGDDLDPNIFLGLDRLTDLSLRNAGLTSLRDSQFAAIPNLTGFNLEGNQLTSIRPEAFAGLTSLAYLNLGNNNLTDLNRTLTGLDNLKMLLLHHNQIETVGRAFLASAPQLESIDLQDNQLRELQPDTFADVPGLRTLNLYTNQLDSVPETLLAPLTRLEQLNLSDNRRLTELPAGLIRNVTSLTSVNMERCMVETIPADFFRSLSNLNELKLAYNRIGDLQPDTFADLRNLRSLDVSSNNLTTLVSGTFRGLNNMESLKLSGNRISVIEPNAFSHLPTLQALDLSSNRLTNASVTQSTFGQLATLRKLNLGRNQLAQMSARRSIFDLPNLLQELQLPHNQFSSLPTQWLTLGSILRTMDLTYNRLTTFDEGDCQISSDYLVLDLQHNQIAHAVVNMMLVEAIADTAPSRNTRPTVLLSNNPFDCDCRAENLLHYYRWQSRRQYTFAVSLDNLRCQTPARFESQQLTALKLRDLECEELDGCPDRCHCVRYVQRRTVVNCTGSGRTELPWTAPSNTSVLLMTNNSLTSLARLEDARWANLTELYLDRNDIVSLENSTEFPARLRLLSLANNSLATLTKSELGVLERHPEVKIDLRGNPWRCDCSNRDLKTWVTENVQRVLGNVSQVQCAGTADRPLHLDNLCPGPNSIRGLLVGVTVAGLVLAAGVAAAAIGYYRFRQEIKVWLYARGWLLWLVTEQEVDKDKTYDAFISFSQEDSEFVASHLLPGLERGTSDESDDGPPSYRVCIHYRDWLAGEWIPDQIVRSVQESRRTIVVLSKNFIRSVWGRLEFKAAHHQALQDRTNRVVVVVLGELPPASEMDPELKLYVKFNTYLEWGDPWFWKKLRYAMPHKPLNSGPAPTHLPRPPPRVRQSAPSSKVPASFLASTSPNTAPIVEQIRLPMTCNGNGNVLHKAIAEDKMELVCV